MAHDERRLVTDPITAGARVAAQRLTPEYGPGLVLEVEAALRARKEQPTEYDLDPVSLGSLIVSVATLAWTSYTDLRRRRVPDISPDVVTHEVRVEFMNRGDTGLAPPAQLIDMVVTETMNATSDPH
jgi:hypothetical protein